LAEAPRIMNKRTTVEMGQLHDPQVEIACKDAASLWAISLNCREISSASMRLLLPRSSQAESNEKLRKDAPLCNFNDH
jgi:hypothetical protein